MNYFDSQQAACVNIIMKTPYFYIIKHIPTEKYYAGCKINSSADSSNLMTQNGYKTSSRLIKKLIKEDGLESFSILRIKLFDTANKALDYESRFLQKINAAQNSKFLNRHNGGKNFVNTGGYKLSESTKNKMRKPKSKETIEKQNKSKRNRSKESYQKMVETRKSSGKAWVSEDQRKKIKEFNDSYWDLNNREKHKQTMIEFYEKNQISEETREKLKLINSGENNNMFGKTHSESAREKMKLAWIKRKENNKK
jgi:hypothetical protein